MLVTHWGFSGPVILRLSAWGARELSDSDYKGGKCFMLPPPLVSPSSYLTNSRTLESRLTSSGFCS